MSNEIITAVDKLISSINQFNQSWGVISIGDLGDHGHPKMMLYLLSHSSVPVISFYPFSDIDKPVVPWWLCYVVSLTLKVLVATIDALGHFETA